MMSISDKWLKKYSILKEYYVKYGNVDVPRNYIIDGVDLGSWVITQRRAYKGKGNCKITKEQIELLNNSLDEIIKGKVKSLGSKK